MDAALEEAKKLFEKFVLKGRVIEFNPQLLGYKACNDHIELMVIVFQKRISETESDEIKDLLLELEKETGIGFTTHFRTLTEWESAIEKNPLYQQIDQTGIILYEYEEGKRRGLDEAMEDIKAGRIYHSNNVDEMIDSVLKEIDNEICEDDDKLLP